MSPSCAPGLSYCCWDHLDCQLKHLHDPPTLLSWRGKPRWCPSPSAARSTASQIYSTHTAWETSKKPKVRTLTVTMGDGQYTELTPFLAHLKYRCPWLSPSFLVRPSTTRASPQFGQGINGKPLNSPTGSTQTEAMQELRAPWTRLLALADDSA